MFRDTGKESTTSNSEEKLRPIEKPKTLTPERRAFLLAKKKEYLNEYCRLAEWFDQKDPRVQANLAEYRQNELHQMGYEAETQVINAFKQLHDHKISLFNEFKRAPDSMDLYRDKMDFVSMLPSGRLLGIQLMMVKGKEKVEENSRLAEKRLSAVEYGVREPDSLAKVRKAIDERIKQEPGLKVPYANMKFEMPRGVSWVNQEDVERYPLQENEDQIKSAANIAAQILGNLTLDLNPNFRDKIATENHLRTMNPENSTKLNGYVKELALLQHTLQETIQ